MTFLCISRIPFRSRVGKSQLEAEGIPPDSGIGYSWIFNQDYGSSFGKTFVEVKRAFLAPLLLLPPSLSLPLCVSGNTGVGEIILIVRPALTPAKTF